MRENTDQQNSEYKHFSRSGIKLLYFILTKNTYRVFRLYQKVYVSILGIKFHFEQGILNFGTKFAQKGYFRAKMEKGLATKLQLQITPKILSTDVL